MKALLLSAPKELRIQELERPAAGPDEAEIRIVSMGVCGSDLSAYKGVNPTVRYPLILGHELGGIVERIGENEKNLREGDRVVVEPYIYCGHCYPCSIGRTNCCVDLKVLGTQIDGGMKETLVHPKHLLHKIPDSMPWELVPLTETLAISLHSTRRARVRENEYYAIFGAGPIGLLAAMLGIHLGAKPILIDVIQSRLDTAKRLGVPYTVNSREEDAVARVREITGGNLAHAVLEASGSNAAITTALEVASFAGRVVFTGWPQKETAVHTAIITKKELDVCGSRTANREFEDCIRLIANHDIDVEKLVTRVCQFEELPEVIGDMVAHPESYVKVVAMLPGEKRS